MKNRKFWQIFTLSLAAIAVFAGSIIFVGATAGWFDQPTKITLDAEYTNVEPVMTSVTTAEFDELIKAQKSFLAITYLPGCSADILSFTKRYTEEHRISYYYYIWSELRDTPLHDQVKYTPSVMLFSNGRLVTHLRADSNDDIEKYNNYDAFAAWLDSYL